MKIANRVLIFWFFPLFCLADSRLFKLDSQVHNNNNQLFIPHHGSGRFGNYLAMSINYPSIEQFNKQLIASVGKLNNRGEAHITVITPIEYYDVLRDKLTIEQLDQIAQAQHIQASEFKPVCLGRGQAKLKGDWQQAYFIVVKSAALLKIRQSIEALYIKHGGGADDFEPAKFYPHITVGFSDRDLHLSDGVIKDKRSCYAPITVKT
jgi:2'-5' RNA ligase